MKTRLIWAPCLAATCGAALHASTLCVTPNAAIPDAGAVAVDLVDPTPASIPIIVTGLRVDVTASHPWVGDLRFELEHVPSGTTVVLLDRPGLPSAGFPGPFGCGGDDVVVQFDDAAANAAETTCSLTAVPVLAGPLRPDQALATFAGVHPGGTWRFVARDESAFDAGTLAAVCLHVDIALDCNGNGIDDAVDIAGGGSADANGDGVPDECAACAADLDGDGTVGFNDLVGVLSAWGPCAGACPADLDGSGTVGLPDLLMVLSAWGVCEVT